MAQSKRLQLQTILETLLGSRNVYFQPPANVQISYPCIIYKREAADARFASNGLYRHTKRYMLTVIDQDPDSDIPDKVAKLPMCAFSRHFSVKNLNHDVFSLYF